MLDPVGVYDPILNRIGESIKHHMPVAKEHILPPLTAVLVPPCAGIGNIVATIFPFPISLDYFVDWAACRSLQI